LPHFLHFFNHIRFCLEFSSQCFFLSLDSHAIGLLIVWMAAAVTPTKVFVIPTSPNCWMIVNEDIFVVFASSDFTNSRVLFSSFVLFNDNIESVRTNGWLGSVFANDLTHLSRVQSCLFLLYILKDLFCESR
jgi:hypothetical protein